MSISCIFKPMGGGYEFFDYIENQPSRVGEHIDLEVNINALTFTAEYEVYHISGNANFVGNWLNDNAMWLTSNKPGAGILSTGYPYARYIDRAPIIPPSLIKVVQAPSYVDCNGGVYHVEPRSYDGIPLWIMGSTAGNPGPKQYKYVKIYDGSTLIRDLIPAKRICDGWTGMYCRVGNKFYGGAKVDSFLIGNYT